MTLTFHCIEQGIVSQRPHECIENTILGLKLELPSTFICFVYLFSIQLTESQSSIIISLRSHSQWHQTYTQTHRPCYAHKHSHTLDWSHATHVCVQQRKKRDQCRRQTTTKADKSGQFNTPSSPTVLWYVFALVCVYTVQVELRNKRAQHTIKPIVHVDGVCAFKYILFSDCLSVCLSLSIYFSLFLSFFLVFVAFAVVVAVVVDVYFFQYSIWTAARSFTLASRPSFGSHWECCVCLQLIVGSG